MAQKYPYDESNLNPGQSHYEDQFDYIKNAEKNWTAKFKNQEDDVNSIRNAEQAPDDITNVGQDRYRKIAGAKMSAKAGLRGSGLKFLKKKGATYLIVTIFGGGGLALTTFFSPGLLLIHMKEVMVNKFNNQLASMETRTKKILWLKTSTTTKGICTKAVSIKCKYSSFSDKQIQNFRDAGIEVEYDEENGRKKPKKFIFDNKEITPDNFSSEYKKNTHFRSAVHKTYNPKFAGFSDSIWGKMASKFGLSKKKADLGEPGDDKSKRMKKLTENTKENNSKKASVAEPKKDKDGKDIDGSDRPPLEKDRSISGRLKKLFFDSTDKSTFDSNQNQAIADAEASTTDANGKKISSTKTMLKKATTTLNRVAGVTGVLELVCGAYLLAKAVSYTAKVVRQAQLIKFSMLVMNTADQIKAGTANEEDVTFLGDMFTELSEDEDTKKLMSGTDSAGYKNAAFGDTGNMTTSSSAYINGGGLSGQLSGVWNTMWETIKKEGGNNLDKTCGIVTSTPFVVGSIAVGVISWGLMVIPGASIAKVAFEAGKLSAMISATVALGFALASLPDILADMVAGNVIDENTSSEDAGDALASGSSAMMTQIAKYGGNAPMTPNQAVEYETIKEDIAKNYAEEDRVAHSAFDYTNKNTFLGTIVAWMIPYSTKMTSSLSGALSSTKSIISGSFANFMPQAAKAANASDYQWCQDTDYANLGLATDQFCNIYYGISPKVLDTDPNIVVDALLNVQANGKTFKLIDETTGEPIGTYKEFEKNCINRETPLIKSTYSAKVNVGTLDTLAGNSNDVGPTGRLVYADQQVGASECMFNESSDVTDDIKVRWCPGETEGDPAVPDGLVYISETGEIESDIENCSNDDGSTYKGSMNQYFYMGNAYLYLHYIDQRVNEGMEEGVTSSSATVSNPNSTSISSTLFHSNLVTTDDWVWNDIFDLVAGRKKLGPGEKSGHGDQGHGTISGDAVDIPATSGSPIFAAFDGTIESSGCVHKECDNYGYMLKLVSSSDSNTYAYYLHINGEPRKKNGDIVKKGEQIGTIYDLVGNGLGTPDNHLHFELVVQGQSINAGDMGKYFQ